MSMEFIEKNKTVLSFAAVTVFGAMVFAATTGTTPGAQPQSDAEQVIVRGDAEPGLSQAQSAPAATSFEDMIGEYQAETTTSFDEPPVSDEPRQQQSEQPRLVSSMPLPDGISASDLPPGLPPLPANNPFDRAPPSVSSGKKGAQPASAAPLTSNGQNVRDLLQSRR